MKIEKYKGFTHFADRDPKRPVQYLVVHSFALSVPKMIKTCERLGVGPHYIIDTKGKITQLVSEDKTAWHAGKSCWGGVESLNAASVGIELQNMSLGQTEYPEAQIKSFVALAKEIMKRHHILPENVVGHSDVAPTRKADPGICFPWYEVAKEGIGLCPDNAKVASRAKVSTLLKRIGYDTTDEKSALYAFMRHFMPKLVPVDTDIMHIEENLHDFVAKAPVVDSIVYQCLSNVASVYDRRKKLSVRALNKQK